MAEHSTHTIQRRYPPEIRERAVRMVFETIAEWGDRHGAVTRVAQHLGIGPESLRLWVRQAEVDDGRRAGWTSEKRERMKALERENASSVGPTRSSRARRFSSGFLAAESADSLLAGSNL